jgi:hypothetical protein
LEGLEKELKAVNRARESLGDKAPAIRQYRERDSDGGRGVLGKRRRDGDADSSSDSDVAEDVRSIPMPRDTPPPIPKEIMDKWHAKRRARWAARNQDAQADRSGEQAAAPPVESKTVYESKPVVRDLQKEAVSAFVPTAVKMKIDKGKGKGGLLEPEEADQLEEEGYLKMAAGTEEPPISALRHVTMEDADDEEG